MTSLPNQSEEEGMVLPELPSGAEKEPLPPKLQPTGCDYYSESEDLGEIRCGSSVVLS